jgi:ribonuclease HI
MNKLIVFTDGSVNNNTKVGYGACLICEEPFPDPGELRSRVRVKRFEATSPARLELQTILWTLEGIDGTGNKIVVYTDSQTIIGLPRRRLRLEKNDFSSGNNKPLPNSDLYREFYLLTDRLNCEWIKVKGHSASGRKSAAEKLFSLVDTASRHALRKAR